MPKSKSTDDTQAAIDAQLAEVQDNADTAVTHPATDQVPAHLASQLHQPYPEKPMVQVQNESLTTATPSGYAAHTPGVDIDKAVQEQQDTAK